MNRTATTPARRARPLRAMERFCMSVLPLGEGGLLQRAFALAFQDRTADRQRQRLGAFEDRKQRQDHEEEAEVVDRRELAERDDLDAEPAAGEADRPEIVRRR